MRLTSGMAGEELGGGRDITHKTGHGARTRELSPMVHSGGHAGDYCGMCQPREERNCLELHSH